VLPRQQTCMGRAAAVDRIALVKGFLLELASDETEFERLRREEQELRKRITNFSGANRLPRDDLYDRRR